MHNSIRVLILLLPTSFFAIFYITEGYNSILFAGIFVGNTLVNDSLSLEVCHLLLRK